ncbi:response regulator [Pseudanabaena biceps]|nr:response regulator [Pseudanabaena biceps]
MNSEQQQQRIMGYFIEEAREHLQTIEQGVLNLQDILDDSEAINEVFRAAHSIKGGAAMLGVGSIQHVAHRLEDFFKIIRENPHLEVDERLKSLLLASFDPLAELLDELQGDFKISEELATETHNRVKPVFAELESYLEQLVSETDGQTVSEKTSQALDDLFDESEVLPSQEIVFQEEITTKMRDMLQLFRGEDTVASRSQLQEICNQFQDIGDRFSLSNWNRLVTQIKNAIAQPSNSYRTLAPILIRSLKESQDLVIANRESEIQISDKVQELLPYRFSEPEDDEISTIFTTASFDQVEEPTFAELGAFDASAPLDLQVNEQPSSNQLDDEIDPDVDIDLFANADDDQSLGLAAISQEGISNLDWMDADYEITEDSHIDGPKVGASELKSLAVLFENDDIDFDAAWEDIESNETKIQNQSIDGDAYSEDEFADLLGDSTINGADFDISGNSSGAEESSMEQLFGDFAPDDTNADLIAADDDASQKTDSLFPEDLDASWQDNTSDATFESNIESLESQFADTPDISSNQNDAWEESLGFDIEAKTDSENDSPSDFFDELTDSKIFGDMDATNPQNTEAIADDSNSVINELFVSDLNDDSLSSEEYFASLEKSDLPNSDIASEVEDFQFDAQDQQFDEMLDEENIDNSTQPFALTDSEEGMTLLEDPFAIDGNLEEGLLEASASDLDNLSFESSKSANYVDIDSIEGSEFFTGQPLEEDSVSIFDELGFDNDELEVKSLQILDTQESINDFPIIEQNATDSIADNISDLSLESNSTSDDDIAIKSTFSATDIISIDEDIDQNISDIHNLSDFFDSSDDFDGLENDASLTSANLAFEQDQQINDSSNVSEEVEDFFSEANISEVDIAIVNDFELGQFDAVNELGDFFADDEPLTESDIDEVNVISDLNDLDKSNRYEVKDTDDLGDFFSDSDQIEAGDDNPDWNNFENSFGENLNDEQKPNISINESHRDFLDDGLQDINQVSNLAIDNGVSDFDELEIDSHQAIETSLEQVDLDFNPETETRKMDLRLDADSSMFLGGFDNKSELANFFASAGEDDLTILDSETGFAQEQSLSIQAVDNEQFEFDDSSEESDRFANLSLSNFPSDLDADELFGEELTSTKNNDFLSIDNYVDEENQAEEYNVDNDIADNVDIADITASSTLDNLADFFQGEDDSEISILLEPTPSFEIDAEISEDSDFDISDRSESLDDLDDFGEMSGDLTSDLTAEQFDSQDSGITEIQPDYLSYSSENNLLGEDISSVEELNGIDDNFDFDDLEQMISGSDDSLSNDLPQSNGFLSTQEPQVDHSNDMDFDDLEALLGDTTEVEALVATTVSSPVVSDLAPSNDGFDELENMLQSAFAKDVGPIKTKPTVRPPTTVRKQRLTDSTMRVDVKYLDSLNNLVGELVVNRNLLEQDQERLQQFITNLLHQVQLLSDVSQRMRDEYDRSLLEASLSAGRGRSYGGFEASYSVSDGANANSSVSKDFEGIEFDRYTTFHVLSQEIIELIVRVRESASDIEFVVGETDQVTRQLGTITTQVQDDLKQSRMVPFAQIADRLPRGIRDRALKTGKQAELDIFGRETLIDKAILESLTDPLTHLVNNAIDHGLEDPATRQAAGKSPTGRLTVRAYHQGNQTVISISDDGAGIDPAKVKKSAVSKRVRTQSEVDRLTDTEVYALLFEAGFSTAAQADEFKGRGVGLDVVKTCLDDIRGVIIVDSAIGKGTTFTIRLPLTLSISKAMFCISDRARIAFPVDGFEDMVEVPQSQITLNDKGQPCLPWRDTLLPFQHLSNLLAYSRHLSRSSIYGKQENDELCIIILRNDTNYLALQVDQFLGEYEIVIKQLEGPIPQPAGIAGATVLGDGRVMAIANVLELFDIASGRLRPSTSGITIQTPIEEDVTVDPTVLIVDDSITVRELLSLTFAKVGYRVEQAKDGQDAWEKLRAGLPCDMIFCDIEMPRMDGLDLLSRLQKDARLKDIPVAMLTSRGADRHRQSAIQLGAKGYFTKPYLEEELLSASKRLLAGETLPI